MTWENVLTLLHVAHASNEYPQLHALRNKAIDALAKADLEALTFSGEVVEESE